MNFFRNRNLYRKGQALLALTGILTGSLLPTGVASAQSVRLPFAIKEKRPNPRDPSVSRPLVPPFLRGTVNNEEATRFLDPTGESAMDGFLKSQKEKEAEKERVAGSLLERDMEKIPEDHERTVLEKNLLYQFGSEKFPAEWQAPETHEETASERFYVTFLLALPFTMAASYGLFLTGKRASGESSSFNGPQTIGLGTLGLLLAGGIAWYDLGRWREVEAEAHKEGALGSVPTRSEWSGQFAGQKAMALPPSGEAGPARDISLFQFSFHHRF